MIQPLCPAGQSLNYGGHDARNRTRVYIGTRKRGGRCAQKTQCTSSPLKNLAIHMHEPAQQRARELANTGSQFTSQRRSPRLADRVIPIGGQRPYSDPGLVARP